MTGDRFLLDAHILVWLDVGNPRLTFAIREKLRYADHRFLSAASAWELSLKQAAGKLFLGASVGSMLTAFRLEELPILIKHADRAASLPPLHRDPFDRMLVAQALEENLVLVTADRQLGQYGVPVLFV